MKKVNVSGVVNSAKLGIKKHSPEILTGIGIAGMVSTVVLSVKATPKALQLIEDEKNRINYEICKEARDNGLEECEEIDKLHPIDVVKTTWKCYIPAMVTGTASIICLVGASSVSARRNAALATAYAISETSLRNYKEKVVETLGEKKEIAVRDAIAKEEIEKNPPKASNIVVTGGDTLCYDALSGRYFMSDVEKIRKGLNRTNDKLLKHNYVSLNDFYDAIGLDHNEIGSRIGWTIDQSLIEIYFSSQLTEDERPCLVLDFDTMPTYNFDRWL